jgi:hypothetical protein
MKLRLIQSYRFPNCWSLESMDDPTETVMIFVDKIDPIGSFSEHSAREWAREHGHEIADEYRQPKVVVR